MHTIEPHSKIQAIPEASFGPANNWVVDYGREYVVIENLETFDPFFLNIVTAEDQWLYCSSHGSLSAGRQSPDRALFPYYTIDKIIDNWNTTGPWTAVVTDGQLWNPFRPSIALLTPTRRRLMKSILGDEVVFDELHEKLELRLTYRWQFSNRFGFVRKVRLWNEGTSRRDLRLIDGLDSILPSGVDSRMQLHYSCLADAYKVSELDCEGALMTHRLAAGITDEPIPLESLLATTVWANGLGKGPTFMDRRTAEKFLRGDSSTPDRRIRAKRGAMFLGRELSLAPGEKVEWVMVAEIDQSQAGIGTLLRRLSDPENLLEEVEEDIRAGKSRLRDIVAAADGIQLTADRDTALYHYNNTLSNILRGGTPENGYILDRDQFIAYLDVHNIPLRKTHASWLGDLPDEMLREDLLSRVEGTGDVDLLRLTEEYLPLILSRRHGDPSRPWNQFNIRMRDESGKPIHYFEGNWRDIFQNWEALALSFPDFLGGFISKFLNASTIDGFNPYRITSKGVDWEVPIEDDPWASIGYWGDHQIVYLLKLLELENKVHPNYLADRLNSLSYTFADVPYRLGGWGQTLADPRDTVEFDGDLHARLLKLKEEIGADGLLLRNGNDEPVRASLAEKLLLPAAVKIANLVPGGGIWMNTQRPEWNDANNALAGCGLSLVTAAYLYRYLGFVEEIISKHSGSNLLISPALGDFLEIMNDLLATPLWQTEEQPTGSERFKMVKTAGLAIERYRTEVYNGGALDPVPTERNTLLSFLHNSRRALEATLRQNRRSDGLWHSYNTLLVGRSDETMEIGRLSVMLEGQVSVLSAGVLNPEEALDLLETLPDSDLRSERHSTYLLYPDKETPGFLETNRMDSERVREISALATMADQGDTRIVIPDPDCGFRFHPSLTNGYALTSRINEIASEGEFASALTTDRQQIEALYESVFNHHSFTGRSGTMFGYEGLGCVYWHMVSKLMLAAQEVTYQAKLSGSSNEIVRRLTAAYFSIQSGLGYRKSPEQYGAFPAEPYSHSPAHSGASQPGLTGQVKEGILCRLGELGVIFDDGCLIFRPILLRDAEFDGREKGPEQPEVPRGTLSFSVAGTPIVYHRREGIEQACATVQFGDGTSSTVPGGVLDSETTSEIARRSGRITMVEVDVPSHWLIS